MSLRVRNSHEGSPIWISKPIPDNKQSTGTVELYTRIVERTASDSNMWVVALWKGYSDNALAKHTAMGDAVAPVTFVLGFTKQGISDYYRVMRYDGSKHYWVNTTVDVNYSGYWDRLKVVYDCNENTYDLYKFDFNNGTWIHNSNDRWSAIYGSAATVKGISIQADPDSKLSHNLLDWEVFDPAVGHEFWIDSVNIY